MFCFHLNAVLIFVVDVKICKMYLTLIFSLTCHTKECVELGCYILWLNITVNTLHHLCHHGYV